MKIALLIPVLALLGALGISLAQKNTPSSSGDPGRRIEILFLGDQGHHQPQSRYKIIKRHLGRKGYNFTYTEDMSDLNLETLKKYDGLLIYANIDKIEADQESAMLDYVDQGGGLLPIHCASFCFHNSDKYVELVGAKFKSHGTGVFKTKIVNENHPVMKGYQGFETWDETYVHERHNENRVLLQKREEEPWTWVRKHGKGRVFYTAYGHDERCWDQSGFHDLIERGILWAIGDERAKLVDLLDLEPLVYKEAILPNYERRDPPPKAQEPLSASESMKYAQVPVDFDLSLFASDPDIVNPIAMNWDERGRLWILETIDYPNNLQSGDLGHDRLRILEDTDNDGKADKFTVFADKLSIPTSIVFANDGVIITNNTQMLFLKDTDGDDKADERKVLFSGWNTGDTHAGPSNLKWGFDNWIWGTVGYSGFRGKVGGEDVGFATGVFRFKPDGSKIEFLQNTTNNTWGLGFTENGDVVGSTANNNPSFYMTFPRRYYTAFSGLDQPRTPRADVTRDFYPNTPDVRQVDAFGNFTAAAGHSIYTARNFPEKYWNRLALICGPTGSLLYSGLMDEKGCAIETTNGGNLYASGDTWSDPVAAEVGPDGAVWLCDWYNIIVQHNPTPSKARGGYDAKRGKGNAYVTPLRDKQHGRIYRVGWKEAKPVKKITLSKDRPSELVAALKNDNMFWRMHAQRLLVERGKKDVVPELIKLTRDTSIDKLGINPGAIHALWTLHGLGASDDSSLVKALEHPSRGVQRAALKTLPASAAPAKAAVLSTSKDPRTLRDALLALSEAPASHDLGAAIHKAWSSSDILKKDQVLADATRVAAGKHAAGFLKTALMASPAAKPVKAQSEPKEKPAPNLIPNPGFETISGTLPKEWRVRTYRGRADHKVASPGRGGKGYCLQISSASGSDSSMHVDFKVDPGSTYELSAWIKTENIKGARGAQLNVHALPDQPRTPAVKGTSDWKQVRTVFKTGGAREISINCLFGGWGVSTGTAWWDDISVRKISGSATASAEGIEEEVAIHFKETAGPPELRALVAEVRKTQRKLTGPLLVALGAEAGGPEVAAENKGRIINLATIPQKLLYDKKKLEAKAGELITIRFHNNCDLPHNLVLCKPGSIDAVSKASIDFAAKNPNEALKKDYVPPTDAVLQHTKMLNTEETEDMTFEAPAKPGVYPYICTFPGHSLLMRGELIIGK